MARAFVAYQRTLIAGQPADELLAELERAVGDDQACAGKHLTAAEP